MRDRVRASFAQLAIMSIGSLMMLAGLGVFGSSPVAFAAGTCTVTPGSGSYPTVSSATTDAACATVLVPAGSFPEQVVVDHPVKLVGAGQGKTVFTFTTSYPSKALDPISATMWIKTAGTTISNLTFDGESYNCIAQKTCSESGGRPAIDVAQGGVTIDHVTIENMGALKTSSGNGVMGFGVMSSANSSNGQVVVISNCVFQNIIYEAVGGVPPDAPLHLLNSTILGIGSLDQVGVTGYGPGSLISGNLFKNFHQNGSRPNYAPGALVDIALRGSAATISNNTFINTDNGIVMDSNFSLQVGSASIIGNTFTNTQTAITLALNVKPQIVKNNTINTVTVGAWGYDAGVGIFVCGDAGDIISGNVVSNAARYGIDVLNYSTPNCTENSADGSAAKLSTLSGNTIKGSGLADIRDVTHGGGSHGTIDAYANNVCSASLPSGLCTSASHSGGGQAPAGPSSTATPHATATVTATPRATATVSPLPTGAVTGTSSLSNSVRSGGQGDPSSETPVFGLVAWLALLVMVGGAYAFMTRLPREVLVPVEHVVARAFVDADAVEGQ